MKIVDRQTFLAMPSGTVFSKYAPCIFSDLCIKGDTWDDDFLYQAIVDSIEAHGTGEWGDALLAAEESGASVAMDFDCQGRDGCFEAEQLFAVWEPADVKSLIARLSFTLSSVGAK